MTMNNDLRRTIVDMVYRAKEGHIPSAFSIVDIIATVYDMMGADDHFVLSKGHGCAALYAVLHKHGKLSQADLDSYGTYAGRLGGHPDRTKAPVEASTGSLGHGIATAAGMALGYKIQGKPDRVICLVGDGECHEGTVWETALVAQNLGLSNLCVIVDYNGSAAQILAHPNIVPQWGAFGWDAYKIYGHDHMTLATALKNTAIDKPTCIVAITTKGKGVPMLEGHGAWHHKIPNETEYQQIMEALA
jgi:transketolase